MRSFDCCSGLFTQGQGSEFVIRLEGYEVFIAYDGQEGICAAATLLPDVILLDIGMPHLDGYAVCRYIHRQPWGASITVISLTGFGQEADKQRSRAAGSDEHLLKPINYKLLIDLLAKTIESQDDS
ncbi:response regulator [Larkinella insperata]|uniref:Response regulator n=1 Tax=Larkinella insperata TaxID=332158 RepID=A0ABW3QGM7_9BACT